MANTTRYTYTCEHERWIVTFTRDHDLAKSRMIDDLRGPKRLLAQLAGFDGAYLRFTGTLQIEHHRGTALLEQHTNDAIWELMYFGHARSQYGLGLCQASGAKGGSGGSPHQLRRNVPASSRAPVSGPSWWRSASRVSPVIVASAAARTSPGVAAAADR